MCCLYFLKSTGSELSNLIDKEQFWKYAKLIPLINTIFWLVRVIRNRISDKSEEAIKSGLYAVGGILAVVIPIYLGVTGLSAFLLCNAINNGIGGLGSIIVDRENDESFKIAKFSVYEDKIYERVINSSPLIGAWYCIIKSGLYAFGRLIFAVLIAIYFGVAGLSGFLLCNEINNGINGLGSIIADIWHNESFRNANWSDIVVVFYERVIKAVPLIVVGYCLLRALVYLIRHRDKRQAKSTAKDIFINCVSVGVACVVFHYFEIWKSVGKNSEFIQNGFACSVLESIRKLLSSQIFTLSATQCINVVAQLVRNSSRLKEAENPYEDEPKVDKFIHCLQNSDFNIDSSDKLYMKSDRMRYGIKCLVAGYKNITNELGNGESALELAFQGRNPAMLQAVIAFTPTLLEQEDSEIINKMLNETDSDSNRCVKYILRRPLETSEAMSEVHCCGAHKQYDVVWGKPIHHHPLGHFHYNGKRVLSLDGGGTRGVVALEILRQLEKRVGNIGENFDLIVGTSTGGLIALLLADGKRCEDIQKLYFRLKDEVFSGRKGNVSKLEDLLKDVFGEFRLMREIPHSTRVAITTNVLENKEFKRKVFTNLDEDEEYTNVPIWVVARCTSAAPGFLPPFKYGDKYFYDGGLTANNPSSLAFPQMRMQKWKIENSTIISIGNGIYSDTAKSEELSASRSNLGQLIMIADGSLHQLVNQLIKTVTQTDSHIVEDDKGRCEDSKAAYYRLTPMLPEKLELDETDDEKLVNAIWHTKVFARNNHSILDEIAARLTKNKLILENKYSFVTKYEDMFEEIKEIGSGGFGVVYKVMKKSDRLFYAIKVFEIRGDLDLKEIKNMNKLDKKFVVQYIDSWIEAKVLFKKSYKFLFIQMELYSYNLRTFLNEIHKETNNEKSSEIFNYFISCELLIELIECVNYLNSLNPPIIHRNLKPENILISDGINGRFLKLCDFELSKPQEDSDPRRIVGPIVGSMVGTVVGPFVAPIVAPMVGSMFGINYMEPFHGGIFRSIFGPIVGSIVAPIVGPMVGSMVGTMVGNNYMEPDLLNSLKCNTKPDIYSLALIATGIFRFKENVRGIRNDIDLFKNSTLYSSPKLKEKFNSLLEILSKCLSEDYQSRPNSTQLFNSINEWTVHRKTVRKDENVYAFRQTLDKKGILKTFFETKLRKKSKK